MSPTDLAPRRSLRQARLSSERPGLGRNAAPYRPIGLDRRSAGRARDRGRAVRAGSHLPMSVVYRVVRPARTGGPLDDRTSRDVSEADGRRGRDRLISEHVINCPLVFRSHAASLGMRARPIAKIGCCGSPPTTSYINQSPPRSNRRGGFLRCSGAIDILLQSGVNGQPRIA